MKDIVKVFNDSDTSKLNDRIKHLIKMYDDFNVISISCSCTVIGIAIHNMVTIHLRKEQL